MRRLAILGATGSIGLQTLDVVRGLPGVFEVVGLTAHSKHRDLFDLAREFSARRVVLTDESIRKTVEADIEGDLSRDFKLTWGDAGVRELVQDPAVDLVVASMVGSAGLGSAVAALEAGKDLALANKETLVVGGPLVTSLAQKNNARLLPVDSEHGAVFQCLQAGRRQDVKRIVLTASGGPFRDRPLESLASVTVAEALNHPTWRMGPKITIDSATMMNKALEIIEAHWLFGLSAEEIAVMVHPQSVVHSFVEFNDGSVLAQASPPDMKLPIQYALTFPERISGPAKRMDWTTSSTWEFHPPARERYPALELGYEVVRRGGTSGAALNAANEAAVAAFLAEKISFTQIVPLCKELLSAHSFDPKPSLDRLLETDRWAREEVRACISRQA